MCFLLFNYNLLRRCDLHLFSARFCSLIFCLVPVILSISSRFPSSHQSSVQTFLSYHRSTPIGFCNKVYEPSTFSFSIPRSFESFHSYTSPYKPYTLPLPTRTVSSRVSWSLGTFAIARHCSGQTRFEFLQKGDGRALWGSNHRDGTTRHC